MDLPVSFFYFGYRGNRSAFTMNVDVCREWSMRHEINKDIKVLGLRKPDYQQQLDANLSNLAVKGDRINRVDR